MLKNILPKRPCVISLLQSFRHDLVLNWGVTHPLPKTEQKSYKTCYLPLSWALPTFLVLNTTSLREGLHSCLLPLRVKTQIILI